MMRTGTPPQPVTHRPHQPGAGLADHPPPIYNGLPVELAGPGGPLDNQTTHVPIATNGRATLFSCAAIEP